MKVIRAVIMFAFAMLVCTTLILPAMAIVQTQSVHDQLMANEDLAMAAVMENMPAFKAVTVVGFYNSYPAANYNPFNLIANNESNPFNISDNPFNVVAMTLTDENMVDAANYEGMQEEATVRSRNSQEGNLTQSLNSAYPVGMNAPTSMANYIVS